MNIKLTIGFKAASRLSDVQKVKLIRCQGEKLQAPEPELQSIIRFCGEKNCIPSGLALVFEYADNADRILDLIAVIRHQQKLLAPANYPHFRERLCIVIRVYLLLSRLIVVISRWRSLQWTACPLLLMRSNKSKVSLVSELRSLHQMLKKFSIQANYSATGWQASFTAKGFDLLNSAFEEFFRIEEHVDKSFTGNSSLFMFRFSGSMHNKSSPTILQYSSCIDKIGRWQRSIASQAGWTDNQYFGDTEELLMLKSLTDLDADFTDFCKTFPRINGDCASIFPTVVVRELEEVPSFEEDSSEDLSQGKLEEETYSRPALLSTGSSPYSQKSTTSEPSLVASPCSSSRQSLISSPSVLRVLQPQAEFTTIGMSSDLNSEASYFSHYEERARPRTVSYPPSTKLRPLVGSLRSPIRSLSKHQKKTVVYHQPSILYQTLKRIDEFETLSEQERAMKKIRVWFRFYFPRRKLSKRLFSRKVAASVIDHIMDCLWARVTTSRRYQRKIIRQGAALNIQRMFRGWRVRHRVAAVAHADHLHQQRVQMLLGKWAGYVLAGSVIRRFLVRLLAPMKERLRGNTAARLTVVNAIRVCFMKEVVCLPPSLKKGPSNSSIAKVSSQRFAAAVAASSPTRDRQESAAIAIQKVAREFLAMQRVRLRKMRVNAATKIAMFIVHATAKRRHRRNMITVRAAVRIQQLWRGMCVRREMFREVRAGVILNEIWRKHQAYKSLKAQLRRVDRPYTIVLRGVRNIGPKYVNNEQMKVRVSVWWNPLLHIVGRNDYDAVLQAKQPQLIYVSSYAKIVAENDDGNSAPSPAPSPSPASQVQQAPLRPLSSPLLATGPRSPPPANTAPLSPSSGVPSLTSSTYPALATRGADAAAHRHTLSPTRALRQTLNFALQIGTSVVTRRPSKIDRSGRLMCCFDDVAVKIPGCHGNSVVKFEIFDGERRMGISTFYMGREGAMMFWGGEYQRPVVAVQQRRAVQLNARTLTQRDDRVSMATKDSPLLEFRIIAGAPMRSRCQWAKLVVHGSGPFKRCLQQRTMLGALTPFDQVARLFLSLDEFGLHFFENKYDTKALSAIAIRDMVSVTVDISGPSALNESKSVVEDLCNVRLVTSLGDDVFMRFADSASRSAWVEALECTMAHAKKSQSSSSQATKPLSWMPGWFAAHGPGVSSTTTTSTGDKAAAIALPKLQEEDDDDSDDSDDDESSSSSLSSRRR